MVGTKPTDPETARRQRRIDAGHGPCDQQVVAEVADDERDAWLATQPVQLQRVRE